MSKTNFITLKDDGSAVISSDAAHCLMRLLAVADDDTRLNLCLNRVESDVLDRLYGEMAAAGVGGHLDGLTPAFHSAAA